MCVCVCVCVCMLVHVCVRVLVRVRRVRPHVSAESFRPFRFPHFDPYLNLRPPYSAFLIVLSQLCEGSSAPELWKGGGRVKTIEVPVALFCVLVLPSCELCILLRCWLFYLLTRHDNNPLSSALSTPLTRHLRHCLAL